MLRASGKLHSQLLWRHRLPRQYSMLQPLKVSCYKSFTDQGHLDLTKKQHEVPEKNRKLGLNIMYYHTPFVSGFQLICAKKGQHLKICKTRRRLQPELLNGILSCVQLRSNDANSREHREAAVVDFALLSMVANKTCYESSWPETKQNLRHDARSDCASVVKYNEASNQLCQALALHLSLSIAAGAFFRFASVSKAYIISSWKQVEKRTWKN